MAAIASAAAAADDSAHPAASSSASPAVATAPADSMDEGEQATHSLPAAAVVASEGAPAHAAVAPAAAAPAVAAPAVAAPLAPVQTVPLPVQAGVLDQRAHDALSPATQHSLQQACEQVRQAARGPAAATLRLCIALEHAAQEILAARGFLSDNPLTDSHRRLVVANLGHWVRALQPDLPASITVTWTRLHHVLASANDRAFWHRHADRIGSMRWMLSGASDGQTRGVGPTNFNKGRGPLRRTLWRRLLNMHSATPVPDSESDNDCNDQRQFQGDQGEHNNPFAAELEPRRIS